MNKNLGFTFIVFIWCSILLDIKYSVANFGRIPYGKSLVGYLVVADPPNACGPIKPINRDTKTSLSIFLIVEDGGCEYDTKAKYGEIAGAKLIVVVSSDDGDVSDRILNDNGIGIFLYIKQYWCIRINCRNSYYISLKINWKWIQIFYERELGKPSYFFD